MKIQLVRTWRRTKGLWALLLCCLICLYPTQSFSDNGGKKLKVEGEIYYRVTRVVKNPYKGQIKTIEVLHDTAVTKDQILGTYTLDQYEWNLLQNSISQSQITSMAMNIKENETQLNSSQRDLDAALILLQEGMASQLSVESKRETVALFREKLTFANEELRIAKRNLKREKQRISKDLGNIPVSSDVSKVANLVSPIDGNILWVIEEQNWELNKKNTKCFTVANTNDILVMAKIFVEDYPMLSEGMKATVTSKIYPEKTFDATIRKLPLKPIKNTYTALSYYHVELEIPGAGSIFREGNSVTVSIPLQADTQ